MYQRDKKKQDYTKEEWAVMAATRKTYLEKMTRSSEPMCGNAQYWLTKKWTNRKRKSTPPPTIASYYMEVAWTANH